MASEIFISEESGTYTGHLHPHNGYYAGDFSLGSVVSIATRMPATGLAEVMSSQALPVLSAA